MNFRSAKSLPTLASCLAGILLSAMVHINGLLAAKTNAYLSSTIVHIVGTLTCLVILLAQSTPPRKVLGKTSPLWAYSGGILGASVVILCNLTVNSPIGLSGTVAMMLLGQTLCSAIADHFGWMGIAKKRLSVRDGAQMALILCGCMMLLFRS
ncbi:MAG: DMT family transporter [Bdellovibrionota bacterium]